MAETTFINEIKRNQLVLALYVPAFLLAFCQALLDPVLPLFAKNLDINYGLIGLVVAGFSIGMLLGDLPAGVFVRVMGRKKTMLLGLALSVLSTASLFWIKNVPGIVFFRMLSGFGIAMFGIARHAYLADCVSIPNRGRVIALLGGIFRLGSFAGPAVGGIVAAKFSLSVPFLLYGAILSMAFLVVLLFVRQLDVPCDEEIVTGPTKGVKFLASLKANYRPLTFAMVAQLFAQMIRRGRGTMIPLFGADILGLDVETIGFIVSIAAAIDMSLFLPAGWIMDRIGRKAAIVPAFVIMAAGMALVPLAGSVTGLIVAAALMGLGNGLSSGAMMTLGADLAPVEGRGEFLGVWRFVGDVGASGGPLVVGSVADILNLPLAAIVMAAAGALASAIFLFKVPETLKKESKSVKVN